MDGSEKQLAVYSGAEVQEYTCGYFASSWSPRLFIAPEEYLSYGIGDAHNLTTKPNDPNTSRKEYKIQDHLGNTRVVLDGTGAVIGQYDYKPFGGILWQSAPTPRKSFIDKEKDKETNLSNFGVRNYSDELGRFMSVDADWEKYRNLTPYNYAENRPLVLIDPSGYGPKETEPKAMPPNAGIGGGGPKNISSGGGGRSGTPAVSRESVDPELYPMQQQRGYAPETTTSKMLPETPKTQRGRTSKSGKYSEPKLPDKEIVNENGVTVEHYYKSGDHAPAHMHVKGNGKSTRIGSNGKPLKGNPELSTAQQKVVEANKARIRKAGNQISKYQKYQERLKSE